MLRDRLQNALNERINQAEQLGAIDAEEAAELRDEAKGNIPIGLIIELILAIIEAIRERRNQ